LAYWSNFENSPRSMSNVEEVRMTGQDTSHWKFEGPPGMKVELEARATGMDPNRGIGWNSIDGEVHIPGEVRFEETAPGRTHLT
jgi:uncharacterized membrane protein